MKIEWFQYLILVLPQLQVTVTPFSVTRFAMHRIYANRINSRGISRVFCDLRSQKTPCGILPVNSNYCRTENKCLFYVILYIIWAESQRGGNIFMKKYWKWILLIFILVTGVQLMNPSEKYIRAMYIPRGKDKHLMIDQKNGTIFTVDMPEDIRGKDGKKISQKELKRGNIVAIYGDGIMLESYPGQYPGVSKIKVLKEGKPTDADQYKNILDQF